MIFNLSFIDLFSQHYSLPIKNFYTQEKQNFSAFSGFKPLIIEEFKKNNTKDTLELKKMNWLQKKVFFEQLIRIKGDNYFVQVSPIVDLEIKKEGDNTLYTNSRGYFINGNIGNSLYFQTSFVENQALFPNYLDTYIREFNIVPGQGYKRDFNNGFDYAMSSGFISLKTNKYFTLQFGHGKHFIGDGYRSLILSDVAFNYPFLRIQTRIGKIQYTNLYAEFQDIRYKVSYETGFLKKYMSSHHINYNINEKFSLSLFEAVIWRMNHAPGNKGFDINYLNPIIFFRPVEYSLNSPDNMLIGLHSKFRFSKFDFLYGQFILDEFSLSELRKSNNWWGNKYGYQIGVKFFNFLKVKKLNAQIEYNLVRPYTYAHHNTYQNYAHYNQPLAHPLGANFDEKLLILNYRWKKIVSRLQIVSARIGGQINGDSTSYGSDIYMSTGNFEGEAGRPDDYGIKMFQGSKNKLFYYHFNIGYIINPSIDLKINLGYVRRNFFNENEKNITNFYFLGLTTSFLNKYYDF